jgi:chromosome partitioning protein
VILDGAAKLEKMIAAAVKCADLVLIPIQPSPLDLWACAPLVEMIAARRTVTDGAPEAAFVVMRAKKGTRLTREVRGAVEDYQIPVIEGAIYDRTVFARAMAGGGTVLESEPDGPAAWEINHLTKQVRSAFDV